MEPEDGDLFHVDFEVPAYGAFAQHSVPQMEFINGMLQERFRLSEPFASPEQVRDFIVQEICRWNKQWQPTSLLLLFAGFVVQCHVSNHSAKFAFNTGW